MIFTREKSCYTPKFNFCQSPDYFFCAFTNRCERDGYYNPFKYDDSYKGVVKEQYREMETKDTSKEKPKSEKEKTESEKSDGNKRFNFEEINHPVTALKALIANRFCEVTPLFTLTLKNLLIMRNFKKLSQITNLVRVGKPGSKNSSVLLLVSQQPKRQGIKKRGVPKISYNTSNFS